DAETAARDLGLTLTQRRFSKEIHLPMAGFPYRYANSYIARLIGKGHMVAVADQLEDSRQAKGLVKRGVVRVITSGTVMEHPLLKEIADNFLLALAPGDDAAGLAFADISTGNFQCTQLPRSNLLEELTHLRPSEVILPPSLQHDESLRQALTGLGVARLSSLEEAAFTPTAARQTLQDHFQVTSLEAFGDAPLGLIAAGAILRYLKTNHLAQLGHITALNSYHLPDYLPLDAVTRRNLELTRTLRDGRRRGTVLHTLDHTQTRMGARLLRRWLNQPLYNLPKIQARLNAVETLVQNAFLRQDLRATLRGMFDLERLAGRIGYGNANGRDLVNLKTTLTRVPAIKTALNAVPPGGLLADLQTRLNPLTELVNLLEQALVDDPPILLKEGGLIKPGFNPKLEALRQTARAGRSWLAEYEAAERERTGIKNLRLKYNQVFGFFIEVTKSNLSRVPPHYERRATIAGGERFTTAELKTRQQQIITAEETANSLEYDLFVQTRQAAAQQLGPLRQTAQALARLDVLASLAEAAAQNGYTKPAVSVSPHITLREGRHPVVEQLLPGDAPFVPNDCRLNRDQRLIIVTGPNMSGKSVYLRQVALAALMAQIGSFVAAAQADIGLVDRLFVRAGASDDIGQGRSTFLVEMSETAHILRHATQNSLIVLDEVGRGTSTYDGLSLAWAVAEEIHQLLKARCLFATHFHELTALGRTLPGAANYSMAVREQDGRVIFLRKLKPGGADRSYGLHVARLAGLPRRVLDKAQQILASLEAGGGSGAAEYPAAAPATSLAEQPTPYRLEARPLGNGLLLPGDDKLVWEIVADLYRLDIANLTPIEALLRLNRWQQQLKGD
ncbi:MAG: DNA mismatch repair protein MutS, partial [Anaerolineae bacterium]